MPAPPGRRLHPRQVLGAAVFVALLVASVAGGLLLWHESATSRLQARELARYAARLDYALVAGPSEAIRFPAHGPFDRRLGYTELARFAERLQARGFALVEQVRFDDALLAHVERGLFPPYAEKTRAGLDVFDCRGEPLYGFRYPWRGYARFEDVPAIVAQALLFIENRELLDESRPTLNPAVDWVRFARAALGQLGRMVDADLDAPGGSTLATQIEKYRHSPAGITLDAREKLRQMVSASVRAYRDGEHTLPVRRRLVLDYLNTVPLSAAPGHGEVNGLGDGLWVWFGADFERVNALLAAPEGEGDARIAQGQALRQVVALMIAHRRPSWYLAGGREELARTTDAYLRLFAEAGLIGAGLRDAALARPLAFRDLVADPAWVPATPGKGTTAVRTRLAGLLDTSLYGLDRLDAELGTTLHGGLQQAVGDYLGRLADPAFARSQGLIGERMLDPATLGAVRYSFTLVERTAGGNRVRIQTDTTDQPLDINEGSKLELGSTAKLRVLATYLELVAELHARLAVLDPPALRRVEVDGQDRLTRWAIDHLASTPDRSLPAMLEAALERRFSASPGEGFFTGGGRHSFGNFNAGDNAREPTLREALQASINLPFVRLMRELVRHTMYQVPGSTARLLEDNDDPRRVDYLVRFADREGQLFLRRFWRKYQDSTPEEMRSTLLDGLRPGADRLAAVFRYLEPEAPPQALADFLARRLGEPPAAARLAQLYARNAPEAFDLPDRGYVARVHPLELWLVAFRLQHPEATLAEAVATSAEERQQVYRWLFRTRAKGAQDSRIFTLLEVEAFLEIHRRWARLGYPFGHLVPSLATALGSSGDRPAALAELMGIIVNDGLRLPVQRIDTVRFARATPYETAFAIRPVEGDAVMAPEVARALRGALSDVVEGGTARRLAGAFKLADGSELALGGKTGTGDNRIVVRGRAGLALNRTATFVFYLGPRHFGTLTAYVIGPEAASYRFTSGLPVQILKSMGPLLIPHLEPARADACRPPPLSGGPESAPQPTPAE
ncbi:MAG TPA: transglycosylase domain-containing protein [Thauera sp.]|uniref:transglycosylase domain-containing protein n=1 Tax=Thauera sp. TaxID=1905334 RepID=UPI002615312A|nr:transglycosylase domain-containing protein [Thauera sp.]MCP5226375.1 penicillin-binding protein [Thauera sp.]HPE03134.1 transglycosylase domain-containing protein [Thauera sp.]HRV76827.1 transglycosylase domain-containing protein [Thauera sp.]